MKTNLESLEAPQATRSVHPMKFAMWLFIVTVTMMFAAWTSAYIVKQAEGGWREFELPSIFWLNTAIIVLSSIALQWAYFSAKKDNLDLVKILIGITTVLGVAFLAGQWIAWGQLVAGEGINGGEGVHFTGGNSSESFLYVITGVHAIHLISAVIFLIVVLFSAIRNKVHSKNMVRMEICTTYWHFLGVLWVYLYIFLLLNR